MNNLTVVLPYCSKDAALAKALLKTISDLDDRREVPSRNILLATDTGMNKDIVKELAVIARRHFEFCETIFVPLNSAENNWHRASMALFRAVANQMEQAYKTPWLWLEPDCVPLAKCWIEEISNHYAKCPKKFMGHIVTASQLKEGVPHMAGPGVYPNNSYTLLGAYLNGGEYFDLACAPFILPRAVSTPLIQHFWGKPGLAPTFKQAKMDTDPENTLTLDYINPKAVLFHRCKDGSLSKLLFENKPLETVKVDVPTVPVILPESSACAPVEDEAEAEANTPPSNIDISQL